MKCLQTWPARLFPASNALSLSALPPFLSGQHPSLSADFGFAVLFLFWPNQSPKAAFATAGLTTGKRSGDLEHPVNTVPHRCLFLLQSERGISGTDNNTNVNTSPAAGGFCSRLQSAGRTEPSQGGQAVTRTGTGRWTCVAMSRGITPAEGRQSFPDLPRTTTLLPVKLSDKRTQT